MSFLHTKIHLHGKPDMNYATNQSSCHRSLRKHCNRPYKDGRSVGVKRYREATTLSKLERLRWMTY